MRALLAVAVASGVFLAVRGPLPAPITRRIGRYLRPPSPDLPRRRRRSSPVAAAGLDWSPAETALRRGAATAAGAVVGILAAQGDLFVAGPSRSLPALTVLGAAAGWLIFGMRLTTLAQRRARRLRFELPVVADALALQVLSGESVESALDRFVAASDGVAAEDLTAVLAAHRDGSSLAEALHDAAGRTPVGDAARLYGLLAHAHATGGRLADALVELSTDLRAGLAREMTAEGGRRALAGYGPILGLMVPVALLFLLYPTLVGLRQLAGGP